jgi:hypothetical protein
MKTIKAYQCPICESIHALQSEAKSCEKDCKAYAKADEIEKARVANIQYWRNYPRLNATCLQDIIDMSIEASAQICPKSKLKSISFDVRYTEKASNSHSCPVDGVTNWCNRDKDSPESYPGLTGSIKFEYENYNKKKTDIIEKWNGVVGINTGSGGYGSDGGRYSVTLFMDDFPLIKAKIDQERENVRAYQNLVSAEQAKFHEEVTTDKEYLDAKVEIEKLQLQINNLNNSIGVYRQSLIRISNNYKTPHNKILDETFNAFSNEFIKVANIGI